MQSIGMVERQADFDSLTKTLRFLKDRLLFARINDVAVRFPIVG
jgi:hypothetical protein